MTTHQRYEELEVLQIAAQEDPQLKPIVFMIHGYGANSQDLLGLATEMNRLDYNWYFPNGFLTPNGVDALANFSGRAWFHIDIVAMNAAREGRKEQEFMDHEPQGLSQARNKLSNCLAAILKNYNHDNQVFLGGFSQGAMLAFDLACYSEIAVAGLILFSGAIVNRDNYRKQLQDKSPIPFFQSHGREDMVIPYRAGQALSQFLQEYEFLGSLYTIENGGHTISRGAVRKAEQFILDRNQYLHSSK